MKTCCRWLSGFAGLLFLCSASAPAASLIPTNAHWKYFAHGVDLGTAWRHLGFNDSTWPTGAAQLGYGDGDETTVIPSTNNSARPITVYFRRMLMLPGAVSNGVLRLLRDDGALVYINGVEVRRDNMPAGPVNANTLALAAVGGSDESTFFESAVPSSVFVPGTNVIAVEVHQNAATSSDMSFALELLADVGPPWPVVTVETIRSETREVSPFIDIPEEPAVFRITRAGPTNHSLTVGYGMSGSAESGEDYERVPGAVTIPAGAESATVEIFAKDDSIVEGTETAVLTVAPGACPECYAVGHPRSAVAYILDDEVERTPTVVNVFAIDANATEPTGSSAPDIGRFALRRSSGPLNVDVPVYFTISGSASNGVDYSRITNEITIPAGATQTFLNVLPLGDNANEGTETVVVTLEPPGCIAIHPPPPECYEVGPSNRATVFIRDAQAPTNHPPFVQLNQPQNGDTFGTPTNIVLRAFAHDAEDGDALKVEFFAGNMSLGLGTFVPTLCPSPHCPYYELTWTNVPPGNHMLTARATDSAGATRSSASVFITVGSRPTNAAPVVTILTPTNGSVFPAPSEIVIEAETRDPDGYADTVEFFADNQKIGQAQVVFVQEPTPGQPIQFEFMWTNPPPGHHVLVATTRDNVGARGISPAVHIHVGGTNTPTTNTTLIAMGSAWKYNDTGTNAGPAWRAPNFDDSHWPQGPAQLGYGDGDEATVVGFGPDHGSKFITTYFRHSFVVSNAARAVKLFGRLLEDDGAVVYLNGAEVFRHNLPAGQISNGTLAMMAMENNVVDFVAPAQLLRTGHNVVAVEMHQMSATSADLSFDLELRAEVGRRRPWLHIPPQCHDEVRTNGCRLVVEGDAPATCVVECSSNLVDWTPISTNTLWGGSFEVNDPAAVNGVRRFYRLRVD